MRIGSRGTRYTAVSYNRCLLCINAAVRVLLRSSSISPAQEAALDTQKQYYESINLPDVLSIRNVFELYSKFTDEFHSNDTIIIGIPEGAEADLSFVQLIESSRRQAKAKGKTFKLSSPASGSVLKVLERAGFIESFDHEDANFWLHKEVTL